MTIKQLINKLPQEVSNVAKNTDVTYINSLGLRAGILQEYIDEELFANISVLTEVASNDIRKYANAVVFNLLRHSKYSTIKAWSTVFGSVGAESNAYAYSKQRMVTAIAENMDEHIRTKYSGVKYRAIEHMIDMMDGKASPSIIPVFETVDGIQTPVYDDEGNRVYKEVHMAVTPKIQLDASTKLIEILEKQDALKVEHSVTNEYDTLADKLDNIAERQHALLCGGAEITDVQVIGDILAVKDEDDS